MRIICSRAQGRLTRFHRSPEPLRIDCLDSAEAFEQLQSIWQGLERRDTRCTPFNSWVWNSLWWQHHGTAGDRLRLLIARQGNRVVALAPLYIQATRMCKVFPVGVLRFIGTGKDTLPDYLDVIALPECRDAAERAFLDFLPHLSGWHTLHFTGMLQSSSLAGRVREFVRAQPGSAVTPCSQIIQRAALPASSDDFQLLLGREHLEQINHRQHRLDAAGVSELSICATSEELAEASDTLVSLHRLAWAGKQQEGGCTACERFHRAVIRQFFAMDALWLVTLKLDGNIIGVQYLFAWRGVLMFMQSSYSPECENLHPEQVLSTYVIQRGIEQGMVGLDMLRAHSFFESTYARDDVHTISLGYVRPGVRQFISDARNWVARLRSKS